MCVCFRVLYLYVQSRTLHTVKGIVDDGTENSLTLIYFRPGLENKDKKVGIKLRG